MKNVDARLLERCLTEYRGPVQHYDHKSGQGDFLNIALRSARPQFLMLSPVVVMVAISVALWLGYEPDTLVVVYVLIGAVAAHVSVNSLNEYFDYQSGLDAKTSRTPFSGGSGALPENPDAVGVVRDLALASLTICMFIGGFFVWYRGLILLPIGLLGLSLVVFYTSIITRHPLLCLVAPGLAFGPIMITGSYIALTGSYSVPPVLASLPVFFQINNLLLLNQYPDTDADREAGRRHWLIVYGRESGMRVYAISGILAYLPLIAAVWLNYLPTPVLLALLTLPLTLFCIRQLHRHISSGTGLLSALAANVVLCLLTPVLLSVGLLIA